MENHNTQLRNLLQAFEDAQTLRYSVLERFLAIAAVLHALADSARSDISNALSPHEQSVDHLWRDIQPAVSAAIGPAIGHLVPGATRELEEKIDLLQSAISTLMQDSDQNTRECVFAQLIEAGLQQSYMLCEFCGGGNLVIQALDSQLGKLQFQLRTVEAIYTKYVSQSD
jgi:hypothetical protein